MMPVVEANRSLPLKVAFVGDRKVGKSALLQRIVSNSFLTDEDDPDLMEPLAKEVTFEGKKYSVTLVDTNGSESHEKIRPLSYYYPPVDIFVLCYDITDRQSFHSISEKWALEVKNHCPAAKVFVIGLKSDLRNKFDNPVTETEGAQMMRAFKNGRVSGQVSSLSGEGVAELLHKIVEVGAGKYECEKKRDL